MTDPVSGDGTETVTVEELYRRYFTADMDLLETDAWPLVTKDGHHIRLLGKKELQFTGEPKIEAYCYSIAEPDGNHDFIDSFTVRPGTTVELKAVPT